MSCPHGVPSSWSGGRGSHECGPGWEVTSWHEPAADRRRPEHAPTYPAVERAWWAPAGTPPPGSVAPERRVAYSFSGGRRAGRSDRIRKWLASLPVLERLPRLESLEVEADVPAKFTLDAWQRELLERLEPQLDVDRLQALLLDAPVRFRMPPAARPPGLRDRCLARFRASIARLDPGEDDS